MVAWFARTSWMISLKAQYALRALIALSKAGQDELFLIADIAEGQRI
jgi:DNA-binding IscR family transcriptional regulator